MNVRLKLANKEQKTCSNKMSETSLEPDNSEVVDVKDGDTEENEILAAKDSSEHSNVDKKDIIEGIKESTCTETNSDHSESDSDNSTDNEDDENESNKQLNNEEHTDKQEDSKTEEHEQLKVADLPNSDEVKNKSSESEEKEDSSSTKESDHEKSSTVSKLDADALSASLSSSKCLLKRNRDDLDSDDDSGEEEEEPYSKKSHIGEVTPKHVSKLKSSELLASMSSSKSLLKRGIEKVDKASTEESTDAPESKKSNLAKTLKSGESEESLDKSTESDESREEEKENELKNRKEIVTLEENRPIDVKIIPKTLKFPPKSPTCQIQNVKSIFTPSPAKLEKPALAKKEELVKEEVKQTIGAKDLAGQRKLERKRLNKMLAIFDDQKIVK